MVSGVGGCRLPLLVYTPFGLAFLISPPFFSPPSPPHAHPSSPGADVVIVDDMIDTAGTLCTAAAELKRNGARRVFCFATHGLLSGPAPDRIARSQLEEVVVTNTIPLKANARTNEKIVALSVASLLSETIRRVHYRQSVSELFKKGKKEARSA